jgi:hypothetical protein
LVKIGTETRKKPAKVKGLIPTLHPRLTDASAGGMIIRMKITSPISICGIITS